MIDAKQRPLFITSRPVKDKQPARLYSCPDKSPDALTVIAASGNLSINPANGGSGSGSFATAEQGTSLAFRTQVTEAQQSYLFQLCQMNANGTLSDDDVAAEMRHFQNTLLAMMAVDQLTGGTTAAAGKPSVSSGAADAPATPAPADASVTAVHADATTTNTDAGSVQKLGKAIQTAKDAEQVTKTVATAKTPLANLQSALAAYDKAETAYAKSISVLATDIKKVPKASDPPVEVAKTQDDVTSTAAASAKALTDLNKAVQTAAKAGTDAALVTALAAINDSGKAYDTYLSANAAYETALAAAAKAAGAWGATVIAAMGGDETAGNPAPGANGSAAGGGISADVAQAVTTIVQTVVWQSFTSETCLKLLFPETGEASGVTASTAAVAPASGSLAEFCINHLKLADTFRFARAGLNVDENHVVSKISGYTPTTSADPPEQPLQGNLIR